MRGEVYGKALMFDPIGPERLNAGVNAPAVLLCAAFDTIAAGRAKYAGTSILPGAKRTLSYCGFRPEEEDAVLKRLYRTCCAQISALMAAFSLSNFFTISIWPTGSHG